MLRVAPLLVVLLALSGPAGLAGAEAGFEASRAYLLGMPASPVDVIVCDVSGNVQVGGACFALGGATGCLASRSEDALAGVSTRNELTFLRADGTITYGDPYACPATTVQIPHDAVAVFAAPTLSPTHTLPTTGTMTVYVVG